MLLLHLNFTPYSSAFEGLKNWTTMTVLLSPSLASLLAFSNVMCSDVIFQRQYVVTFLVLQNYLVKTELL